MGLFLKNYNISNLSSGNEIKVLREPEVEATWGALREQLKCELDRLEALGMIKPKWCSEYAAPIVVRCDAFLYNQICIGSDFSTGLNEMLDVCQYANPVIEELLTNVQAEEFSRLDISEAYFSNPVDE